jgi:small-conductance mechanosensitive channel
MELLELQRLAEDFRQSNTWIELAVLIACLLVAGFISRAAYRRNPRENSVLFGRSPFDGFLFAVLALVLVGVASHVVVRFQPVVLLKVAVPILVSLAVIRLCARVLRIVFPNSGFVRLVEQLISWMAWVAAALWSVGLLQPLLQDLDTITLPFGKSGVSIRTLIEGAISAGLVLVVTLWIAATFEKRVLREHVADLSMRKVASNITRSVLILVGLLFALSAVGVDLTALSVFGGAAGVGLGFGMQKLAANYVSGFVILLERSLRIGDNVRVDSFEGRITDIKTRYTLIRAGNGRESIVPNESLMTQRVENLSISDRKFNLTTNIIVAFDSDVDQVRGILENAAQVQPRALSDPAPVAFLVNFVPDGLEFSLNFWVADPEKGQANIRSAVNIAILKGLRDAGITIPQPHRVVHVPELSDAARALAGDRPHEPPPQPSSLPAG